MHAWSSFNPKSFFFTGIRFVSHCFLAEYFLPLQSDALLSSAYDTSSLAALGISVPRNKKLGEPFILKTGMEEYSCGG